MMCDEVEQGNGKEKGEEERERETYIRSMRSIPLLPRDVIDILHHPRSMISLIKARTDQPLLSTFSLRLPSL